MIPSSDLFGDSIRLLRLLGHGGMGMVWLGRDEKEGKAVAVKMLLPSLSAIPEAVARFDREVRILARLRETSGVQLLESGEHEGVRYAVMDHIDGLCLAEFLSREGVPPVKTTALLITKLLDRLDLIHSSGVVHRDVKPANIMLTEIVGALEVTLVDFGVASAPNEPWITQSGSALGTAPYMSPEQAFNVEHCDLRTDLWAAAVVAYECLIGRLPFDGPTFGAICVAIHEGIFIPPSFVRPNLPPAVDDWFAKAFAREPEDRFRNAVDMADAWDNAMVRVSSDAIAGASEPRVAMRSVLGLDTTVRARPRARKPAASTNGPWLVAAAIVLMVTALTAAAAGVSCVRNNGHAAIPEGPALASDPPGAFGLSARGTPANNHDCTGMTAEARGQYHSDPTLCAP